VYPPIVGRHSSGPAPDPEDEARLLFRVEVEQPDRETKRNLLGILPGAAVMGVGAWAIDRYTQTSLGAWRYAIVAPLTLFAAGGAILGVVFGGLLLASKADSDGVPRWFRRAVHDLFSGLFAVALIGLWFLGAYRIAEPYPHGTLLPAVVCAAAFAAGVTAARIRRRRLRLAFTQQPSVIARRAFAVVTIGFAAAMPFLLASRTDAVALLSALSAYVVGVFVFTIRIGMLGGTR
jgi:hypothetical protein